MAVLSAPAPARTAAAVPGAAGVRLSAVACAVFRDRREPLIGGDRTLALETLETYGRTDEYDAFISDMNVACCCCIHSLIGSGCEGW